MKKPIYKKWWFWVVAVIVVIAIAANAGSKEEKPAVPAAKDTPAVSSAAPSKAAEPSPEPSKEPEPSPEPEPVNEGTITKAEFDKIKNGMSYEKVTEIIGGPGEVMSEVGEEGDDLYTVMYMYEGEGSLGANANFMFQGGKLNSKAQMGLE